MNLLTHTTSRFIPSSILIFALALSGCGGGGDSKSTNPPPTSTASSVSSAVVSSSSSSTVVSSSTAISSSTSSLNSLSSSSTNSVIASSSSSTSLGGTTTYKVSVHVPESFPSNDGSNKKTNIQLNASNFALVSVSLSGAVLEHYTIKPTDITKTNDGNWTITAPGTPRADTVIIADVTNAIDLPAINTINTEGLVYAPATAEVVDIDIGSTSAFKNLTTDLGGSGTFASQGIDPATNDNVVAVESLVNSVQAIVEDEKLIGKTTVSAALADIDVTVKAAVKEEVLNIKNPTQNTVVNAVQSEGGLHWYESHDDEMIYTSLIGVEPAKEYVFNGAKFEVNTNSDNNELTLSNGEWVKRADNIKVKTLNADGSIVLQDIAALDDIVTIKAIQSISLAGRNIVDMLSANIDTKDFAQSSINPSSVFGAGATAYRIEVRNEPQDKYSFLVYSGDKATGLCPWGSENASDYGGNCNRVLLRKPNNQYALGATAIVELKSPNVTPGQDGSVVVDIGGRGSFGIGVQLVNDAAKTARFYRYSPSDWRVNELVATATYSELNLPGLSTDATAIELQLPQAVLNEADFEYETLIFLKQNGSVRVGHVEAAQENSNSPSIFFNGIANTNIQSALSSFVSPLAGKWGDISSDVFTFTNTTFVHSKTNSRPDSDPNCKAGTSTGNYAWNPKTFIMKVFILTDTTAVDPTDSCSIDTGIKWKPVSGGLEITYQEDGEDVTFLAPKIVTE